jgi:Cytochrome P460
MTSQLYRRCWLFLGSALLVLGTLAIGADPDRAAAPKYTKDHELILPTGYHTWVFVGADLALKYNSGLAEADPRKRERTRHEEDEYGDFHNIYIDRAAYDHFLKTKTFPDPTVLVMEVFRAEKKDADGILKGGQFQGKRIGLEAAVKDSKRPGGEVPWAYYIFQADEDQRPAGSAPAMPDAACYDCHKKHASTDNVWVQFYPALRDSGLQDVSHR